MKTLRIFWTLARPYWLDRRQWLSWVLLLSVIGLGLMVVQINLWINAWSKTFYDALGEFNTAALYGLMLQYSLYIGLYVIAVGQFQQAIDATRGQSCDCPRGAVLRLDNLSVQLPDGRSLLNNLNLVAGPGQWLRLEGRSGLGKSTLLRTLQGLWPWYRGRWQLPGHRPRPALRPPDPVP
ncbi:ATP-binding cassette domain-containing protein [Pseudomonas sp. 21LCFQ02]|uniref:ATP-binding cassette domain-containing protein n=1 Tax=Pseudomonas sp. 21LCFQ02 TaxID=2957505 RepID=UPI00209A6CCE|nr:ATP-binding cassette domain-containing protein [Pseudomonas sp. 21LCFQ02]MCO8169911.1 ATP-binding cassette domain-containing protein [Pseudomonas sp. 21LCFQ02]